MTLAIDIKAGRLLKYTSREVAHKMGNGRILFDSAEELLQDRNTTMHVLVEAYNANAKRKIERFESKKVGCERIFKIASDLEIEQTPFKEKDMESKPVKALGEMLRFGKKETEPQAINTEAVNDKPVSKRKSSYAGKILKSLCTVNPRREATHGFHSMGILINAGAPISFESYIEQGGRLNDLKWDIEKGHVEVID